MKNKTSIKYLLIIFIIIGIILFFILSLLTSISKLDDYIMYGNKKCDDSKKNILIKPIYTYDTSSIEKAMGVSEYIFIGKINRILRTEYKDRILIQKEFFRKSISSTPYTIYSLSVVENINRKLITNKEIEIAQMGGINEDGGCTFIDGFYYLDTNKYYLFMVNANEELNYILDISDFNRFKILGDKFNKDKDLKSIMESYNNKIMNMKYLKEEQTISKYDEDYNKGD